MAVIAAFEFDDDLASSGRASQANGRHGGFGAGADESHFLNGWIAGDNAFGEVDLGGGGGAEAGGVGCGALNGFDDRRKGVAEDHGAPGAEVVDVALPSASVRYAPAADWMNGGAPPTARKARTGELTPPGKKRSALSWRAWNGCGWGRVV